LFLATVKYFGYSSSNCRTTTYMKKKKGSDSYMKLKSSNLKKNGQISMTQIVWTRDFIFFL